MVRNIFAIGMPATDQWQPMITAPKDGRAILALCHAGRPYIIRYWAGYTGGDDMNNDPGDWVETWILNETEDFVIADLMAWANINSGLVTPSYTPEGRE